MTESGSVETWTCQVEGTDARKAGLLLNDDFAHEATVVIEGMEEVLNAYALQNDNQEPISGFTTLFAENAIIDNFTLKVSANSKITFGELNPSDSRRRLSTLATTGTKAILAVRVTVKNLGSPELSAAEISNRIFGTDGDLVNLKSQYEGCSKGRLEIMPAISDDHQEIVDGVLELTIDANGSTDDRVISDLANNYVKARYANIADHWMLCLPPGTDGGWVGYANYRGPKSVFNNKWCGYPSIQVVRVINFLLISQKTHIAHIHHHPILSARSWTQYGTWSFWGRWTLSRSDWSNGLFVCKR